MVRVKLPVGLQVLDPGAQQASFCQESSRHSLVIQLSPFPPQAIQDWPEQLLLLRGPEQRQQEGSNQVLKDGRQGCGFDCVWPLVLMRLVPLGPVL